MPTGDQLEQYIEALFLAANIGVFAIGVSLTVVAILEHTAGLRRRVSRHRKGARSHKPTHIPVKTSVQTHSYQGVAFLSAHVHRTIIPVLPRTEILPKVEVQSASVRHRK